MSVLNLREQGWSWLEIALWAAAFLFLMAGLLVALNPLWRKALQTRWTSQDRVVLSTALGDLLGDGSLVKVVKYQNSQGIQIEVLGEGEGGSRPLIDRIYLTDRHNGFFDFQGEATQLALVDVDSDGKLELIAPTFDENLTAHLNVFKYSPEFHRFEAIRPQNH
jgi:hypothetical protein